MTDAIQIRGRKSEARRRAAEALTEGCWAGTTELVLAVTEESRYAHGWRPLRATLVTALRDLEAPDGPVMTGAQFIAWEAEAKLICKARGDGRVMDRMGMTSSTMRSARRNGADKALALACAHYTLGLPLPVPAEDSRALDEWFRPRFNGAERVAEWLGLNSQWLTARLAGFAEQDGKRVERLPPAWLIRALDWMFQVGAICPYGAKEFQPLWPGQDLDEGGY